MNDDFLAGHDADASHLRGARNLAVISHVAGKRRQFQERRSRIEQSFDAVTHKHLVLTTQAFLIPFGPNMARGLLAFLQLRDQAPVVPVVRTIIVVARIDQGAEALHVNFPLGIESPGPRRDRYNADLKMKLTDAGANYVK